MHIMKLHRSFARLKRNLVNQYSQAALVEKDEYTDTPEYPPILDMSLKARKKRERDAVHEKIKKINTVEEKQIALNMPRYYGFRCILFKDNKVPYNAMPLVQFYTRSHFIPVDKLPDTYLGTLELADSMVKELKTHIEDIIVIEKEGVERNITPDLTKTEDQEKEDVFAKNVLKQINRVISNYLSDKVSHVLSAQVDYEPRHEAFWFVGGVDVPNSVISWRNQYPWLRKRLHEPVDRAVQYLGSPFLTLRSNLPLKPLISYSEAMNPDFKVPKFTYIPESVGYFTEHRHGTNIPGYWPGDIDEFGLLSFHGRSHILNRKKSFGPDDNIESLHCQAIKSSFGWLLSQANYQGFTTYNDLTYPLTTQTVITNGQLWSFYAYQLNTIVLHGEKVDENPKHNICFGTKPMMLYESIDNGKVKGLNEDVLKLLLQFYLNAPEERDHDMKPYLGKEEQIVADLEDDNKRCWLENRYKLLVSNRPRHNLLPEIYLWERIYKIKHNTRFFEAKRRPFELDINPFKRRLDEHTSRYIPKVLRPYPKHKKKFETTYYPDV